MTAACEDTDESASATVVKVDKVQYKNPDTGSWVDAPAVLYIKQFTTVEFRAIKDPSTASWPVGKPVWNGTSGASGSGETKSIVFSTNSQTLTDYKTVTAECGNTITINCVVYDLAGVITHDDNFAGRSLDFGIGELADLDFTTGPVGITAVQIGGLKWTKSSGKGSVTNNGNDGKADYDAELEPGTVNLSMEILDGPSAGQTLTYFRTISAPNNTVLERVAGTGLRHTIDTWSCGWKGDFFLRPTNLSFSNMEQREGQCTATATGWLSMWNNLNHPPSAQWKTVGTGNITKGCKVNQIDEVWSGEKAPPPAYAVGDFLWPIPHQNKDNAGNPVTYATIDQHSTSDAAGKCVMEKGGHDESRVPGDATSNY